MCASYCFSKIYFIGLALEGIGSIPIKFEHQFAKDILNKHLENDFILEMTSLLVTSPQKKKTKN